MAACPTMVNLLGDGDPLLAFTRLEHRVLETIEHGDDTLPIEAAAFSLGLASASKNHLDRLNDFGAEYGYEARQARRYSDRGITQLARLIASNWVIHAVPAVEVFLAQQSDGSFGVMIRTRHQWFVTMKPVNVEWQHSNGTRQPVDLPDWIDVSEQAPEGRNAQQLEEDPEPEKDAPR